MENEHHRFNYSTVMKQARVGHARYNIIFSKTVNVYIIFSASFEHFICENERNVTVSFQF